jgi:hypothetical protein
VTISAFGSFFCSQSHFVLCVCAFFPLIIICYLTEGTSLKCSTTSNERLVKNLGSDKAQFEVFSDFRQKSWVAQQTKPRAYLVNSYGCLSCVNDADGVTNDGVPSIKITTMHNKQLAATHSRACYLHANAVNRFIANAWLRVPLKFDLN